VRLSPKLIEELKDLSFDVMRLAKAVQQAANSAASRPANSEPRAAQPAARRRDANLVGGDDCREGLELLRQQVEDDGDADDRRQRRGVGPEAYHAHRDEVGHLGGGVGREVGGWGSGVWSLRVGVGLRVGDLWV